MECRINYELHPAYYETFHCLMDGCIYNCCQAWHIGMDKNDYMTLQKVGKKYPELDKLLQGCVRRIRKKDDSNCNEYAELVLGEGYCPLLTSERLCGLQMKAGSRVLPKICQTFPRINYMNAYSGCTENSLSTACEGVIKLLWSLPEGVDFVLSDLPQGEQYIAQIPDNLHPSAYEYATVRSLGIDILQDRRISLYRRLVFLGMRLDKLEHLQMGVDKWAQETESMLHSRELPEILAELPVSNTASKLQYVQGHLGSLTFHIDDTSHFREIRKKVIDFLETEQVSRDDSNEFRARFNLEPFLKAEESFLQKYSDLEYFYENLAVHVFFTNHVGLVTNPEKRLWDSYVSFCDYMGFIRFMSIMSMAIQLDGTGFKNNKAPERGSQEALIHMIMEGSRCLLHNKARSSHIRDAYRQHDNFSLANMAVALGGDFSS